MKFLQSRKIIFITPIVLWLLSQLFLLKPQLFYVSITLGALLLAFSIKGIEKNKKDRNWSLFFFFPAIFFLGASLYVALIPNYFWIQFILLLSNWFIFSYFRNIYYLFNYNAPERIEKLDSLMTIAGFFAIFTLAASMYGLPTFLGWNFWPLWVVFIILSAPLFFKFFILGSLKIQKSWPIFLAAIFILAELSLALYLLPLSFNVLGLFVAIFFYLLLLALRLALRKDFSVKTLLMPFTFSVILIIILLLTSRWF